MYDSPHPPVKAWSTTFRFDPERAFADDVRHNRDHSTATEEVVDLLGVEIPDPVFFAAAGAPVSRRGEAA